MKKKIIILAVINFIFLLITAVSAFSQTTAPSVESNVDGTVCFSQEEAKAVYQLAAKGSGFDAYAAKSETDIKERDSIITKLEIKLAQATQEVIDLSKNERQNKAELEQYRQYFFTNPPKKCKFSFICKQ